MSYVSIGSEVALPNGDLARNQQNSLPRKNFTKTSRRNRTSHRIAGSPAQGGDYPIIVHCHLCWDWVWQRPQQFVSRLSRRHPILFVETIGPDPALSSPVARYRLADGLPNLTLLRLQFPCWRWPDGRFVDRERRRLVKEFLSGPGAGRFENPVQWFYDPMTVTSFAGHMDEIATVYDCMDELSKFREAPTDVRAREADLLARADVVFTGGRRLWEAKRQANSNCHFYGCGVDVAHFGSAREAATIVPADLLAVKRPVLGYFGVVDERMDYELVANLADANRDWSIVIIGPVLKVNAGALPQRPNLHWLGQRSYADLPAYCKGFDACLMPFALNEATEFINPTKALEYMAAGKPVISTAVPDVVANFGAAAKIAGSAAEFVRLCEEAVTQPDRGAVKRGLDLAAANSWDQIVSELEQHVEQAILRKRAARMVT